MAKKSFYEIGPSEGYLREGSYLEVRRQINYRGDRADFKPFLNVPVKDLEKRLKESQAEEKKVFEEMKKAVTAWDEHGAQTLLLQKAIEYMRTPEVTHTGNEWKRHKDGSWEISNLVYKMKFHSHPQGQGVSAGLAGGAHVQPVEGQSIQLERIEQHGLQNVVSRVRK